MKLEITHKGKRYWGSRVGLRVNFWSSHKWPMYHGHIDSRDPEVVWAAFYRWLPFSVGDKQDG